MFGHHFSAPLAPTEPPKNVPPPTPVNFPHYAPEIIANAANESKQTAQTEQTEDIPAQASASPNKKSRLTDVLQGIVRPTELGIGHFQALGVRIYERADPTLIIPDYYEHVPDFATWDDIPYDQARDINESTRRPISNGNRSPGIQIYLDRKRELSIDNNAAYRTVRRMPASKSSGPPAKLGNAYEFYRHLDNFSSFWDDTSVTPPPPTQEDEPLVDAPAEQKVDEGKGTASADEKGAESATTVESDAAATDSGSKPTSTAQDAATPADTPAATKPEPDFIAFRTSTGGQMPPDYRINMTTAFLKLVAYDFGCNVSAPRTEPRLYLNTGTITAEEAEVQDKQHKDAQTEAQKPTTQPGNGAAAALSSLPAPVPAPAVTASAPTLPASIKYKGPCSYFSSGCIFVFRSPTTREAARAGIVEGPLAAISARHTTSFLSDEARAALSSPDNDRDTCIDLARELVAALVTAQHRAREGRAERRIGKGEWWATKPRWGGGSGGPIGREVDSAPNTDEAPDLSSGEGSGKPPRSSYTVPGVTSRSSISRGAGTAGGIPGGGNPNNYSGINTLAGITGLPMPKSPSLPSSSSAFAAAMAASSSSSSSTSSSRSGSAKKQRKGMAIYDNYRMVRPPSSNWDKKTRYTAIGRNRTADYDDIFVISALFHHISIVRVRVPERLLDELDGADYDAAAQMPVSDESLRGLDVIRSPWYDLFKTEDRLAAMRLAWGMMAYLMRKDEECSTSSAKPGEDVQMKDA